jgi:hypothetical protein
MAVNSRCDLALCRIWRSRGGMNYLTFTRQMVPVLKGRGEWNTSHGGGKEPEVALLQQPGVQFRRRQFDWSRSDVGEEACSSTLWPQSAGPRFGRQANWPSRSVQPLAGFSPSVGKSDVSSIGHDAVGQVS